MTYVTCQPIEVFESAYNEVLEPVSEYLKEVELRLTSLFPETMLDGATQYLIKAGGKRIRPALVLLGARFSKINQQVIQLATAVEILHSATLVHDDIIDQSLSRRGYPTAHVKWGHPKAILLGDYYYAKFLKTISSCNPAALFSLGSVVEDLVKGEFQQQIKSIVHQLSEDKYFRKLGRKSGSFLAQCCRLGALLGEAEPWICSSLEKYGYALGLAFQLQDDLLDFLGDEQSMGKPAQQDLSQGIITLPVIHCLNHSDKKYKLIKLLCQGLSQDNKNIIYREIINTGSLEYTSTQAKLWSERAKQAICTLPAGREKSSLNKLADLTIKRSC